MRRDDTITEMPSIIEKVVLFTDHVKAHYEAVGVPFPNLFEPTTPKELEEIETVLSVILPNDLRNIAPIFCGVQFVLMPQLPLDRRYEDENVIDKTIRLREVANLPHQYIFLSEWDESFILMETQSRADLPTPVYWLGVEMLGGVDDKKITEYYKMFSSYEEYFIYALDKEVDRIVNPWPPVPANVKR